MAGMQKIQPKISELRIKYKNDVKKMNEESMKLYSEHKVNPMGGCLPALVQVPIFIALYGVITQPLKYIFKYTDNQLYALNHTLNYLFPQVPQGMKSQIHMVEKAKEIVININQDIVQTLVNKIQSLPDIHTLTQIIVGKYGVDVTGSAKLIENSSSLSMDFFGINLASFPNEHLFSPVIIIPILAAVTTYLSSKIMAQMNASSANASADATMQSTQNTMMAMMPFVTLFVTYSLPAGLGLYWIISNIFQIVQQYFLNKYINGEALTNK